MASYTLQLNTTYLVFVPRLDSDNGGVTTKSAASIAPCGGTVVQVCLRNGGQDIHAQDSAWFSVDQEIITNAIEALVVAHVNASPALPRRVVVTECPRGYTLVGVRKPWKYGHGKQFFLGQSRLQPAKDKWNFHITPACSPPL